MSDTLLDFNTLTEIRTLMPTRFAPLLQAYTEDATQQLATIQQAVQGQNTETVTRTAHSLKSSSRQLGAVAVGETAARLEHTAREGDTQALPALLSELENQLPATLRALAALTQNQ